MSALFAQPNFFPVDSEHGSSTLNKDNEAHLTSSGEAVTAKSYSDSRLPFSISRDKFDIITEHAVDDNLAVDSSPSKTTFRFRMAPITDGGARTNAALGDRNTRGAIEGFARALLNAMDTELPATSDFTTHTLPSVRSQTSGIIDRVCRNHVPTGQISQLTHEGTAAKASSARTPIFAASRARADHSTLALELHFEPQLSV